MLNTVKAKGKSRFLFVVMGIVLVAIVAMGALSSQVSGGPTAAEALSSAAPASSAQALAGAAQPSASTGALASSAAKPFLSDYQDPQPQSTPNGFLTIVSLMWKLAVVVGLIYLVVLGLRYFSNRTRNAVLGNNLINVLEKTTLGQNRELYLVHVAEAGHALLLGASGTNINVLLDISDPDVVEELQHRPQPALPSAEPFLNYLKKFSEHAKPIAAEVAAAATTNPSELLKPADLLQRIEDHRQRLRDRTASLQGTGAALEPEA